MITTASIVATASSVCPVFLRRPPHWLNPHAPLPFQHNTRHSKTPLPTASPSPKVRAERSPAPLCSYISERFARVLLSDALHTANAHGLHPFPVLPSLFHSARLSQRLFLSAPLAPAFPRASSDTSQGTPYGSGSATRNGSRASNAPVSLRSFISVIKLPLPVASYGVSEIK